MEDEKQESEPQSYTVLPNLCHRVHPRSSWPAIDHHDMFLVAGHRLGPTQPPPPPFLVSRKGKMWTLMCVNILVHGLKCGWIGFVWVHRAAYFLFVTRLHAVYVSVVELSMVQTWEKRTEAKDSLSGQMCKHSKTKLLGWVRFTKETSNSRLLIYYILECKKKQQQQQKTNKHNIASSRDSSIILPSI